MRWCENFYFLNNVLIISSSNSSSMLPRTGLYFVCFSTSQDYSYLLHWLPINWTSQNPYNDIFAIEFIWSLSEEYSYPTDFPVTQKDFMGKSFIFYVRLDTVNEKYKGDAMLQKTFTVDFLTKKKKANEGEIPQYYVENSHPAVIEPDIFDMVQFEMKRRKEKGGHHSGASCFSSKIVCGECGNFYGSKVWHSTSKYRRTIWHEYQKPLENHIFKRFLGYFSYNIFLLLFIKQIYKQRGFLFKNLKSIF